MSQFFSDSIFWIEVEKVKPNPYQPRHEFDQDRLRDLAESIRMYGVLQPLVVTRTEVIKEDGGLATEYELISGERRLRASKLAGLLQVPVIIRSSHEDARVKLELAIIENLQREDLNPVDRARAFQRLVDEFNFKHIQIAEKVGKSREYVTNSLRLLTLPEDILNALSEGKISEGHARPLMMLNDRPEEQSTLFKEIIFKKLTVREAEAIARKIAVDKVRKKERGIDPEIVEMEQKLTESLGTRVQIERKDNGGKVMIDFFSNDDLREILKLVESNMPKKGTEMMEKFISTATPLQVGVPETAEVVNPEIPNEITEIVDEKPIDDRPREEKVADEESEDLYSVKNFSI
jgi:ParB family transcriptional regulator, chromosome partitioning protein